MTVSRQLGRPARGAQAVAHRCLCGLPDVVQTAPRLSDSTPFPTTFYLTCPKAAAAVSRLESSGLMREMSQRLAHDPLLSTKYSRAHEDYLARRRQLGEVTEIEVVSSGGMPERVKCLHALLGHALAVGPGVNPFGDETLAMLPAWWEGGPCVSTDESAGRGDREWENSARAVRLDPSHTSPIPDRQTSGNIR